MAQAARLNLRMQKELKLLLSDPPHGASFPFLCPHSDHLSTSLSTIDAQIEGPEGTVYENGYFHIKIQIPERYPFQPPIVTFATPIYHPNIDTGGRICLDILNLPPKGAWQPSLNISTVLTSIGLLLSEPNPDDGLMCEASKEYKYNRQAFDQKARSMTEKHAKALIVISSSSSSSNGNECLVIAPDLSLEEKTSKEDICSDRHNLKHNGLSGKLSLQSTGSASNLNYTKPAYHLTSAPHGEQTNMDVPTMESKYDPCRTIIIDGKPSGIRRKLSLEASMQSRKKSSHEISTPLLVQPSSSSALKTNEDMIQSQDGKSSSHGAQFSSVTEVPDGITSPAQPSKELQDGGINSCQTQQAQPSTTTICPTMSKPSSKQIPTIVDLELLPESRDEGSNNLATQSYKPTHSSRKLSLGRKRLAEIACKDNKENNPAPVSEPKFEPRQLSSSSSPSDGNGNCLDGRPLNYTTNANNQNQGLHKKLSLQPAKKLQGSQDSNNKVAANTPNTASGNGLKQHQNTTVEPPPASEVIVMDSDESDSEKPEPPRKKLMLARKPLSLAGKRRPIT